MCGEICNYDSLLEGAGTGLFWFPNGSSVPIILRNVSQWPQKCWFATQWDKINGYFISCWRSRCLGRVSKVRHISGYPAWRISIGSLLIYIYIILYIYYIVYIYSTMALLYSTLGSMMYYMYFILKFKLIGSQLNNLSCQKLPIKNHI